MPIDIDEAYLDKIKDMLTNYKPVSDSDNGDYTPTQKTRRIESFSTEKELHDFMRSVGFSDYKIPKHDMGIYYDEGLTIKKHEDSFEVKIVA